VPLALDPLQTNEEAGEAEKNVSSHLHVKADKEETKVFEVVLDCGDRAGAR
jgi:hypothetical protein